MTKSVTAMLVNTDIIVVVGKLAFIERQEQIFTVQTEKRGKKTKGDEQMQKVIFEYYCDRCGKKMNHKNDEDFRVEKRKFNLLRKTIDRFGLHYEKMVLCDDCSKSLKQWVKEGKNNV